MKKITIITAVICLILIVLLQDDLKQNLNILR